MSTSLKEVKITQGNNGVIRTYYYDPISGRVDRVVDEEVKSPEPAVSRPAPSYPLRHTKPSLGCRAC